MENKAHFALIGAFVLTALFAGISFVAWLSNSQFDQQFDEYEVVFEGAVRGLSAGSEVRFNGLRVGEVTKLRWDGEDANIIYAEIQVIEKTPIVTDSIARLEPLGLTGLNYIQIFSGSSNEMFPDTDIRGPYRIIGEPSQLDTLLSGSGSIVDGGQQALARINATLSEDAIRDFHAILANIRTLSEKLSSTDIDSEQVRVLLETLIKTGEDVSYGARSVGEAASGVDTLIEDDLRPVIARILINLETIDKTLTDFSVLAQSGTGLSDDARATVQQVSRTSLRDLENTLADAQRLIASLNRIVESLEESPAQFIVGAERETVELPQ